MSEQGLKDLLLSLAKPDILLARIVLEKIPFRRTQILAAKAYAYFGEVSSVRRLVDNNNFSEKEGDLLIADALEIQATIIDTEIATSPKARKWIMTDIGRRDQWALTEFLNDPQGALHKVAEDNRVSARRLREKHQQIDSGSSPE